MKLAGSSRTRKPSPQAAAATDDLAGSLDEDLVFCSAADAVLVATEADRQFLLDKGMKSVHVVSAKNIAEVAAEIGASAMRPWGSNRL